MSHPFLQDPENLRAFQQLTAVPTGSVRKWEQLLGWKPGRLQRYLANLVKYELAEVESCRQHSIFRPRAGVADCSGVSRSVAVPVKQGHCSSLTKPSLRRSPRRPAEPQPGADLLIDTMNQSMKRFGSYLPVLFDNDGSLRAAKRWLVDQQIPLEEAITLLYRAAEAFSLDLAPGHDYPESIAYFSKFVVARWKAIQRDRHQLKLFPKLEMQLERSSIGAPPPVKDKSEPDRPPATEEQLARWRAEYDLAANDQRLIETHPNTPRIRA